MTGDNTYSAPNSVLATEVGTYTWSATYSGDGNNNGTNDNGVNESVVTIQASPVLTTQALETASGVVGTAYLSDTATLTGSYYAGGTISFSLKAPDGTVTPEGSATVTGDNTYSVSEPVLATEVGTYTWSATYSGDGNNNGTNDNGVNESVVTIQASPSLTTQASETASGVVGTAYLSDTATLTGSYYAGGTISFSLKAPDGTVTPEGSATVTGDNTYSVPEPVLATEVGTYTWSATYSGDGNNNGTNDNGVNESVVTIQASPVLTTQASETASGVVGTAYLSDTATLTGSYYAGGTISFSLKAPDGTVTPEGSATVTGDNTYSVSEPVLATEVGTYTWSATYSGDGNNNGTNDNGVNESVVTIQASPVLTTQASETASGVVGTAYVSDTATLTGSYYAGGTISFSLKAPDGSVTPEGSATVTGDNTYSVPEPVLATEVGTYTWSATYSGDGNNNGTNDNGVNESVVTIQASPVLTTQASETASGVVGSAYLSDTATLTGSYYAGGTISFSLKAPDGTVTPEGSATVTGDNTYSVSEPVLATEVGTYTWSATYSGDGNNNGTNDNGVNESVVTIQASPVLTTQASETASGVVGTAYLSDTATLTGSYYAGGTISFSLKAPDGTVTPEGSATVTGDNTYSVPEPVLATEVGTYTWSATYTGDGNNLTASDDGSNETVVTIQASPVLTTQALETASGVVGTAYLSDTATLTGSYYAGGTISFSLKAPDGTVTPEGSATVTGDNTYSVSEPVLATEVGTYTWSATYSGDGNNNGTNDNGVNESVVTIQASPVLTTQASETASGVVGTAYLSDTATLTGSYYAGGTISFSLTAPDGTVTPEGSATVTGDNTYSASEPVLATEVGTYTWSATYSGDGNNNGTNDNGVNESVVTIQASPVLTTQALETASGVVGTAYLSDTATLTGSYHAGGTISFSLTDPNGNAVTLPANDQSVTVSGDGAYTTPTGILATEVGTYTWSATYTGDGNNLTASDDGSNETVVTIQASPVLTTQALETASGVVGTAYLSDTATLSGSYYAGGTISFSLTAPDGTVTPEGSATVTGDNTYSVSEPVLATEAGTYTWSATYSGDGNNNGTNDNGVNESVVTIQASPVLTTQASETASGVVGTAYLSDTATLTGSYYAGGTISFSLTAPDGTVTPEGSATVTGDNTYSVSEPVLATEVGTYTWSATYTGDGNNLTASDDGSNETVVTIQASPVLTTQALETASGVVGTAYLSDTATLSGSYYAGGMISFSLTDPNGNAVTLPANDQSVTVSGDGAYTTPTGILATEVGTYTWSATYTGDGNNLTASDDGSNETVVTIQASPVLTTQASETASGVVGTAYLSDTATLTGSYYAGGTISFSLTDPNGNAVTLPANDQSMTVSGDGAYTTPTGILATEAGTYTWSTIYSGDGNNLTASDDGSNETVVTIQASPVLTTQASETASGVVGTAYLSDTATLTGSYYAGGTISFSLKAPDGTVTPEGSATVTGDNTYSVSEPVLATEAGTYTWSATYSGDGNNNGTNDNGVNETVVTIQASPVLTTQASETASGVVGTAYLSDTATLTGSYYAGGTISFSLTAPDGTVTPEGSATVTGDNTYSVSEPVLATEVGTYTWSATYSGDGNNNGTNDNGVNESVVTIQASPVLTTQASETASGAVGTAYLSDTATLTGSYYAGGTISFSLTDPNGNAVTLPANDQSVTVSGDGAYTTPTGVLATEAGTYTWSTIYSGDGNNLTASDDGSNETTVVSPASPTLTTLAAETAGGIVGATILTDTARLTGSYYAGGTISFSLTDPNGNAVTLPANDQSVTVSGDGAYTTPTGVLATEAGTYTWSTIYSGDGNNLTASDDGSNETTEVSPASPTLTTQAGETAGGIVGVTILTDTATLMGSYYAGGTISFSLMDPNGNAVTLPANDQSVTVSGDGAYTMPTGVLATEAGTYTWSTIYSGDGNNLTASDDGSNETTEVSPASLTITTQAAETAGGIVGAAILTDTATLSGGYYPGGTISFSLTAPDGSTALEGSVPVTGDNTYSAPNSVLATEVGTYTWSATYSGDGNNNSASDDGSNETTVVSAAPATVPTTVGAASVPVGDTAMTLSDTADLEGAYNPTGSITFTLTLNGSAVSEATQTETVSGNGTYGASYTLPTTGTVAGTYVWTATYSGDGNNQTASDDGSQ